MSANIGNAEILAIVEAVAREKNIPRDAVIEALEESIRVAARRKYGQERTIRAEIDKRTGEIRIFREMIVVEEDYVAPSEDETLDPAEARALKKTEINPIKLSEALHFKPDAQVGEILSEQLPAIDLGRVAAQSAKQVITSRVRQIECNLRYEEFQDRVGKIVSGVVEKVEHGSVIVKIGNVEALLKNEYIMREERAKIRQGERIRALVYEVNKDSRGPQILLSRTHKEFLAELFAQEVPEIYDKLIEIKAIARDPGSRAKIAVFSSDPSIDPVGSCVGMRGSRVQAVITELGGEKIDIIEWSQDPATTIINALSPADVSKVIIDEENSRIEVVVPDDQLSIAIGKRGQNVRLASDLIGWEIDVLTEETESKRRNQEFSAITKKFMSALDLEEILAQLLASEGYNSIQELADSSVADIASIEGLDESIAEELINRAKDYAATHEDAKTNLTAAVSAAAKISPKVMALPGMTEEIAVALYTSGVKSLDDLADLSRDEFFEKVPGTEGDNKLADKLIMAARDEAYFKKQERKK